MTRLGVTGVGPGGAIASWLADTARAVFVRRPGPSHDQRELAFRRYQREVRRRVRVGRSQFVLTDARELASGSRRVVELEFDSATPVQPGDVLWLWWRNPEEAVAEHAPSEALVRYWTTPIPHEPSRRRSGTRRDVLTRVVDLSAAAPGFSLSRVPRITPRIFTTSDARAHGAAWRFRLQVTTSQEWPHRASAFLSELTAGEQVEGWALPHPHRLTTVRSAGLAVVTGSGAAAVFAALRSGVRDVGLIWGLGDKTLAPWVKDELRGFTDSGALRDLRVVRSPHRVTDELAGIDLACVLEGEGWLFVSGNESMAEAADAHVRTSVESAVVERAERELRYIVSA
ncbi:MAG TPA: hypothetical protein PK890_03295 [Terrimesophilobacter sp.]|nr:hypothetical protein [Terrimesophilobacter sp.]